MREGSNLRPALALSCEGPGLTATGCEAALKRCMAQRLPSGTGSCDVRGQKSTDALRDSVRGAPSTR